MQGVSLVPPTPKRDKPSLLMNLSSSTQNTTVKSHLAATSIIRPPSFIEHLK